MQHFEKKCLVTYTSINTNGKYHESIVCRSILKVITIRTNRNHLFQDTYICNIAKIKRFMIEYVKQIVVTFHIDLASIGFGKLSQGNLIGYNETWNT